ncbi:response regulator transcription factor [Geothrix sp. 21YS21S-2]|uniref:response regulator transcription factor n=1 Tax=Geothrix sp. 21YS21S-2 TaxID=3068893 RepID=UPI0027B8CEA8|nr:response regulator transcription factor [Geothrix sp. 21YS21S-2]
MRILLVDDDASLAGILADSLTLQRPDWEVRVALDGAAALEILRAEAIDLLVSDIQMPSMDGIALLQNLRADPRLAGLPVILASGRNEWGQVREGMCSGADDYLVKPFSGRELIQAIEIRLQRLRPPQAAQEVPPGPSLAPLTERERDVLALIGKGLVTKEIAERLDLSPHTVGVHRSNIMRKLDLHTSAALAALAVRARLS